MTPLSEKCLSIVMKLMKQFKHLEMMKTCSQRTRYSVMDENGIQKGSPEEVYHRIIDGTGISMNQFSDEKIVEFIRGVMNY